MKGGDQHQKMVTHVLESMNEVITNDYDISHKAIDIVASDRNETNIIAIENGTVTTVVNNVKGPNHKSKGLDTYGNYVKVKQDNGKTALYAHMKYKSIQVNKGQYIEKGTVIGTIGDTGNAYGKHLHLEIQNQNNVKENPTISLNTKINSPSVTKKQTENIPTSQNSVSNTNHTNHTPKQNESIKQENLSISNTSNEYLNANKYKHGSIVDALKSIGINSSYNYRKKLAQANNIKNYQGSYFQNIQMLNLLKQGKLKKV